MHLDEIDQEEEGTFPLVRLVLLPHLHQWEHGKMGTQTQLIFRLRPHPYISDQMFKYLNIPVQ